MDFRIGNASSGEKPQGRRERKKLATRRKIFRAAVELFTEKGFDATTVEEIAERADVGKGTVFNYFPQKTAFLIAAYTEWLSVIQEDLGPVESLAGSARAKLGRVFGYLIEMADRHRTLARQVLFENMRHAHVRMTGGEEEGPGAGFQALQDSEAVRLMEDMTLEVVRRGKDEAEIRPDVDEVQAASLIAAAVFHTLVRGLVRGDSARDIQHALAAKLDIIFTGLNP